jgi:hypothetical protein
MAIGKLDVVQTLNAIGFWGYSMIDYWIDYSTSRKVQCSVVSEGFKLYIFLIDIFSGDWSKYSIELLID